MAFVDNILTCIHQNQIYNHHCNLQENCFLADIDACDSLTCQNGGSCADNIVGYKCECTAGYTGDHCEGEWCSDDTQGSSVRVSDVVVMIHRRALWGWVM